MKNHEVVTRKEYIEREEAKEKLCGMCRWGGTTNCEECEHPIDDIPAADVVPVRHGRWITAKYPLYACSECDAVFQEIGYGFDYCPNCGAKMDGDAE